MPAHYAKAELAERGAIARFKEKRKVASKMRKAIKGGRRAGHPEADALIEEMTLILAFQDELFGSHEGGQ